MGSYTDLLYAQPSWIEGVARILDLGDTLSEYNMAPDPTETDAQAMRADWHAVGEDLRTAALAAMASAPQER
jgi:hypothetical protein